MVTVEFSKFAGIFDRVHEELRMEVHDIIKEAVIKIITSPSWMHETSARTWCTGKSQRDRVEREVGRESGWGIHVNPWLLHVNV